MTSLVLKISVFRFWTEEIIEALVAVLSCILRQAVKADQLRHLTFHLKSNSNSVEPVSPILHSIDDILSKATFIRVKSVHISFASGKEGSRVDIQRDSAVDTVRAGLPRSLKRGIVKLFTE